MLRKKPITWERQVSEIYLKPQVKYQKISINSDFQNPNLHSLRNKVVSQAGMVEYRRVRIVTRRVIDDVRATHNLQKK